MIDQGVLSRRMLVRGSAAVAGAALLGGCSDDEPEPGTPVTGYVTVPGARLYFEERGSGPTLLMIHAGSADAGSFAAIVPILAEHYRVVTYDRRGNSRSKVDGPPKEAPPAVQADDAYQLLRERGGGRADVFGSSAGAIVALDLAARHPDLLRTVVSHEPPVYEVLPDPSRHRALAKDVYDTYRRDGVEPAFAKFFAGQGGPPGVEETEPGVSLAPDPAMEARSAGNNEFFLAYEMRAFMGYRPDIAALKASPARVLIGLGRSAGEDFAQVAAVAAQRLGTKTVEFPGAHLGYATHPKGFAAKLHDLLG